MLRVRKSSKTLVSWLKQGPKGGPPQQIIEMPDPLWFHVEKGVQRLGETGMLEWICHLRPTLPESPEDRLLTMTVRNKCVRGALAFLRAP